MVTSHTGTPMPTGTQRGVTPERPVVPAAADAPTTATDPARSMTGTDGNPDLAALSWDLTVHRLHRAFAECLGAAPAATHGGQPPTAPSTSHAGLADVRLAATRHVVDAIEEALDRMAAGSYGTCLRCAQPIVAERLLVAPTARWCPTCQANGCG